MTGRVTGLRAFEALISLSSHTRVRVTSQICRGSHTSDPDEVRNGRRVNKEASEGVTGSVLLAFLRFRGDREESLSVWQTDQLINVRNTVAQADNNMEDQGWKVDTHAAAFLGEVLKYSALN